MFTDGPPEQKHASARLVNFFHDLHSILPSNQHIITNANALATQFKELSIQAHNIFFGKVAENKADARHSMKEILPIYQPLLHWKPPGTKRGFEPTTQHNDPKPLETALTYMYDSSNPSIQRIHDEWLRLVRSLFPKPKDRLRRRP